MTANQQTCPRRMSDFGPWERAEGLDSWNTGHGLAGQNSVGLSCSFCGSLNPDRFMELVRDGWFVGPTDKNYKAYLGRPYTDEEQAAHKAQWLATSAVSKAIRAVGERDGKTEEQIGADLEQQWSEERQDSHQVAKFYYQHLSQAQRDEFIELHNAGRMRISYPGSLYVSPFFTRTGATT